MKQHKTADELYEAYKETGSLIDFRNFMAAWLRENPTDHMRKPSGDYNPLSLDYKDIAQGTAVNTCVTAAKLKTKIK